VLSEAVQALIRMNAIFILEGAVTKEPPKKVQQIYLPGTEKEIGSLFVVQRTPPSVMSFPTSLLIFSCVAHLEEFVTADENLKRIMERVSRVTPRISTFC